MAKERLSKLQRWILENSYHNAGEEVVTTIFRVDIFRYFKSTYTLIDQEMSILNNFKAFMSPKEYNRVNATISRSIRNLKAKGYIELIGHEKKSIPNFEEIERSLGGYKTKEGYMEAVKGKEINEIIRDYDKWFRKVDLVVKIDKGIPHKTKIVQLTEKGVQKAKELLRLSSIEDANLTVIELPPPQTIQCQKNG